MSLFVALLGGDDKRVLAWYPTQQPPEFAAVLDDVRAQPLPSGHLLRGERLIIFRVVTIQEQRFVFVLSGPVTSSLSSAQLVLGEDKLRKALAGIDPAAVIASPEAYAADLLELLLGIFKQVTFHVPERAPAAAAQPAQGPTAKGAPVDFDEDDDSRAAGGKARFSESDGLAALKPARDLASDRKPSSAASAASPAVPPAAPSRVEVLSEVSDAMRKNIEAALSRQEQLESLVEKSEELSGSAHFFRQAHRIQASESYNRRAREQDAEIDRIAEDIGRMQEMSTAMSGELEAQNLLLDDISANVESAGHVEHGAKELKQASHYQRKSRKRLCLIFCFPCVALAFLVAGVAELAQRGYRAAGGLREKLQAKFKVGSIDDIFADLETVFYHLAELLVGQPVVRFGRRYLSVGCLVWPLVALYRAVAFVLINCFLMGVIMPGIFTLLIFRTKKVEVEKTQMVHRAAVIATESAARKSLRWLGLLSRSLPMTFILAGWPVLIFYHFVPVYGKGEKGEAVGDALVALHVAFVILVQILGTMRVSRAVDARAELAKEKAAEQTAVRDEKLGTFRTNKVGNWIALTSIAVESIQMIVFPMLKSKQELDAESAKSSETEPKDDSLLAYLRTDVFPSFLLRLGPEDVQSGFTWVAIGAVMILIVIFSLQFSFELYTYQNKKIANAGHSEFYFSSFLGAIVYGHGKLGYVKNKVCSVVELLSDTLFLVICNKLILGASCTSSGTCFESETQRLQQVLSLVTFSFYVPLSVMVSPLFLDANSEKDVRFQKTYLMAVNTAKCAMLLFAVILAQWKLSNALSTLLIAFLLFVVTLAWILVRLPSQTVKEALIAPQKPCTIAWINIWRCVSFVAALWSAFCALIFVHTSVASHQAVSVVFLVGLVVLGAAGVVWTYAYTNLHVAAVKRGRMFQKLEENWAEDDQEDAL
eukprot:TRINITY_DN2216_c0_g1_i5.p1 TRINITY_DN2216_c0_g1~~TRINITY_DN2216_c0_g1_i5.p1  ORF type:complete len:934 (+),score=262.36 TRINITY_DN2216_c0_g1_i5:77-2878(+)